MNNMSSKKEVDLFGLLNAFWKNKILIIIPVLVCVLLGLVYIHFLPLRYSSSMNVIIRHPGVARVDVLTSLKARRYLGEASSDKKVSFNVAENEGAYTISVTADEPSKAKDLCYSFLANYIRIENDIIDKQNEISMEETKKRLQESGLSVYNYDEAEKIFARLTVKRPVAYIIKEPLIAEKPDSLNSEKIIAFSVILGLMIGCSYIVLKKMKFEKM